ncbi:MAG TPA: alpha/beta hydrolase, partial [Acetobacteraceae bacterium]|nr:alpha/beta hydrolase [Acetobacteraceae bacterium]
MTFTESFVEADGFRIRTMQAGDGAPLVHLHGAGGMRMTPAHDLLCRRHRVIVCEMPGFGASAENTRTQSVSELGVTIWSALAQLGIERCSLMATSFGARVALWMALDRPEGAQALVLESPAAIRPEGHQPPTGTPEQMARLLYAHPERLPAMPAPDPAIIAKQRTLTGRLRGPDRDPELEAGMHTLATPTLVLFGTRDRIIPPEMGRHYKALLPNCHLVLVYDAGHDIGTERPDAFANVTLDFLE